MTPQTPVDASRAAIGIAKQNPICHKHSFFMELARAGIFTSVSVWGSTGEMLHRPLSLFFVFRKSFACGKDPRPFGRSPMGCFAK